jgi:multiple sugar transport system permease protein
LRTAIAKARTYAHKSGIWGLVFILPWVFGFVVFTAGPMLSSLWISLHIYDLHKMKFVGLENFRRLLTVDPIFWKSVRATLTYAVVSVPLGICGSLALAVLLNQNVRGQRIFRTFFYMPSLVPSVASALLWGWVFNADNGVLNQALSIFGLPAIKWLQDQHWALIAFILMSLWSIGGPRMVIFLAGLQAVPDSYIEAATLDGAGPWLRFRKITLPMLSPVMFFNLVMGVIGSFQVFTSAYVMTNGGPNDATRLYALYLFQNAFINFKLGKACAMAWLLFLFLLLLTGCQFLAAKRWVHYEGEAR